MKRSILGAIAALTLGTPGLSSSKAITTFDFAGKPSNTAPKSRKRPSKRSNKRKRATQKRYLADDQRLRIAFVKRHSSPLVVGFAARFRAA